jgi:hypothetical protein
MVKEKQNMMIEKFYFTYDFLVIWAQDDLAKLPKLIHLKFHTKTKAAELFTSITYLSV